MQIRPSEKLKHYCHPKNEGNKACMPKRPSQVPPSPLAFGAVQRRGESRGAVGSDAGCPRGTPRCWHHPLPSPDPRQRQPGSPSPSNQR